MHLPMAVLSHVNQQRWLFQSKKLKEFRVIQSAPRANKQLSFAY